jgi:hypothetical protein
MPTSKTFTSRLEKAAGMEATGIVVPFDPRDVWGKTRVPVRATVNGYEYRTTIAKMGGRFLMPFAKEHRDASGIEAGDAIEVTLVEDVAERTVDVPDDLAKALEKAGLHDAFERLAFTHRKEHVRAVEEAKKPETRARRIEKCVEMVSAGRKR